MAMVQLSDLFAHNKNFYDTIKNLLHEKVELKLLVEKSRLNGSGAEEFLERYNGEYEGKKIELKHFLRDPIVNHPEWSLRSNGHLMCHAGVYTKEDGSCDMLWILSIDVMSWLRKQSLQRLLQIADCAFQEWSKGRGECVSLVNHPRYQTESFYRDDRSRVIPSWKKFLKSCGVIFGAGDRPLRKERKNEQKKR